jgi:hypothetical protein
MMNLALVLIPVECQRNTAQSEPKLLVCAYNELSLKVQQTS